LTASSDSTGPTASKDSAKPAIANSLAGGHLLAAISTSIVGVLRDHYGRGPMKAKTYVLDDIIVVVMRGSGFTPLEQTIMDSGEPARVIAMREDFQRVMARIRVAFYYTCQPACTAQGCHLGKPRPVAAAFAYADTAAESA
jgi:hypothetical protein